MGRPCLGLTSGPGELLFPSALVLSACPSCGCAGLQPCIAWLWLLLGQAPSLSHRWMAWPCPSPSPSPSQFQFPSLFPAPWRHLMLLPGSVGQNVACEALPCPPHGAAHAAPCCQPWGNQLPHGTLTASGEKKAIFSFYKSNTRVVCVKFRTVHIQFFTVQCKKDSKEGIDHWDGPSGASAQSERLCHLHPWRVLRHSWINPKATRTDPITYTAGNWAGDIPRSSPMQVIPGLSIILSYYLSYILIIRLIKNGSMLRRKQHKFSIVDSCFIRLLLFGFSYTLMEYCIFQLWHISVSTARDKTGV